MPFLTPSASGEHAVLTTYALQQLAQLRSSAYGLSDSQIHATPSASSLSIAGLLRHCGQVAVEWANAAAAAPGCPEPVAGFESQSIIECVADQSSAAETLDYFDACVAKATELMGAVTDLSVGVPIPDAPWFPKDLAPWEARWTLAHITAEIARHAGHADIISETIDGRGSFELNARADGQLADDEEFNNYE